MVEEAIELPETEDTYQYYISSKIVRGMPMKESVFLATKSQVLPDNAVDRDGFHVIYPDGYISWSPKEAFDNSNRLITDVEKAFLNQQTAV